MKTKIKSEQCQSDTETSQQPESCEHLQEIASVAYTIWEQEGRPEGKSLEHWIEAEAQYQQFCLTPLNESKSS